MSSMLGRGKNSEREDEYPAGANASDSNIGPFVERC